MAAGRIRRKGVWFAVPQVDVNRRLKLASGPAPLQPIFLLDSRLPKANPPASAKEQLCLARIANENSARPGRAHALSEISAWAWFRP